MQTTSITFNRRRRHNQIIDDDSISVVVLEENRLYCSGQRRERGEGFSCSIYLFLYFLLFWRRRRGRRAL